MATTTRVVLLVALLLIPSLSFGEGAEGAYRAVAVGKVLIQLCTYMVVVHTLFFRLTILSIHVYDVGSCFRSPTIALRVLERESVLARHFGLENGFQTSRSEGCS